MSDATALADEYWDHYRSTFQLWNAFRGDLEQIEHWDDLSAAGLADEEQRLRDFRQRAEALPADSEDDAATLGAVAFSAGSTAVSLPWTRDRDMVSAPTGFAAFLPVFVPRYPLATKEHGEGYVAKLNGFGSFVDGWVDGLREGVGAGRVATARGIRGSIEEYEAMLARDVADDPLAAQPPPTELSPAEVDGWRSAVQAAIADAVRPGLARLCAVLRDEVLPAGRPDEEAGLCHLPGGEASYAAMLWASTSTAHTPGEVFDVGMEQLAQLDDEYRSVAAPVLGLDDPKDMLDRLRDDPTLRYTSDVELVRDAEAVLARADAAAPSWFTRLPRARCHAQAVGQGALAYYATPSVDGQRGGTFFFNTSDPGAWGRFQLESTTFHEGIPGHHLQLALGLELDVHPVRQELIVTSYVEGWGLYAERLADEMGLYSSPMDRIGMLEADSLRAGRLVVDTGLHAMGWTRGARRRLPARPHRAEPIRRGGRDRPLHRVPRPGDGLHDRSPRAGPPPPRGTAAARRAVRHPAVPRRRPRRGHAAVGAASRPDRCLERSDPGAPGGGLTSRPMGDMVDFPSNGSTASGYLVTPEGSRGPGVLVIQEWWGLDSSIKEMADRLGASGFVALAPDLYHGELAGHDEMDKAGQLMQSLPPDRAGARHERRGRLPRWPRRRHRAMASASSASAWAGCSR